MIGPVFAMSDRCQSRGYVAANGMLFGVAASRGFDDLDRPGDITDHAYGAFERMQTVLHEAWFDLCDVCAVTVYLADVHRDANTFNTVWQRVFAGHAPARCCVGAVLQGGLLVEMSFTAVRA
ncbi:RidA family protein [uncultured Tateyamaria sp.]|uniref:RidA family protein n=1 Tax=uncultured Tateyamaria sp. TaxID=455651 RepID=UPI0026280659|nr:RidA family protein [uncultured Tateyamaria sp.]